MTPNNARVLRQNVTASTSLERHQEPQFNVKTEAPELASPWVKLSNRALSLPRRVSRPAQLAGLTAGLSRGGMVRFPGSSRPSTRRTMPNPHPAAVDLASLLDGSGVGELIPEIIRDGLQRVIQLQLAAFLGAS